MTSLEDLCARLGQALRERDWRLVTAESCTGGGIGAALTAIPGSSDWYEGGVISYSNALKQQLLDVPADCLQQHGAVSQPVALAMAGGARRRLQADLALAVTGVAGPGGGTPDKPVGLVWFAWSDALGESSEACQFSGDRQQVREQAVLFALQGALRRLRELDAA